MVVISEFVHGKALVTHSTSPQQLPAAVLDCNS